MLVTTARTEDVPQEFECPISHTLMMDPVVDSEGNTYERAEITKWLESNSTSPITRNPLSESDLVPNRSLRDSIARWRVSQQDQASTDGTEEGSDLGAQDDVETKYVNKSVANDKIDIQAIFSEDGTVASVRVSPDGDIRPRDICIVIDVSGSMNDEAKVPDSDEKNGLNLLDIVKYATKTVIKSLGPEDRIAIGSFSDQYRTVFDFERANASGKKGAIKAVEGLQHGGCTNLWGGLLGGMEMLRASKGKGTLMLLTDGEPTVRPPRGEIEEFKRYSLENDIPHILTFGFGYRLDSKMLNEFGTFAFIPDPNFVGTTFIHSVANARTRVPGKATLRIKFPTDSDASIAGDVDEIKRSDAVEGEHLVAMQSLQYGQPSDVVLVLRSQKKGVEQVETRPIEATLILDDVEVASVTLNDEGEKNANKDTAEAVAQLMRVKTVKYVRRAIENARQNGKRGLEEAQTAISALIGTIANRSGDNAMSESVEKLLEDLRGQVTEAFSRRDWFNKWGRHYLLSLTWAHHNQQCNNFKDPGVQLYGGAQFKELRDAAEKVFSSLPAPKPSRLSKAEAQRARPVNMRRYYNCSAGCIAGHCMVKMADGGSKPLRELKRGDEVYGGDNGAENRRVLCMVKGETSELVGKDGILMTPYHPIRVEGSGTWQFPKDVYPAVETDATDIYSFVLEDGQPSVWIEGVECVALGHGLDDSDVVSHPFFGSKVVDVLRGMRGWDEGVVEVTGVVRDSNNLVCGYQQCCSTRAA